MSLKQKFLQMEIRQQIKVTILAMGAFATLYLISIIFCYSYEVIDQSYRRGKQYFYSMKEESIVSITYYQNVNLLLYEEMIKLLTHQIFSYFQSTKFYIDDEIFNESYIDSFIYSYDSDVDNYGNFYYYFRHYSEMNNERVLYVKINIAKFFPIIQTIHNLKPVLLNGLRFMSEFVIIDKKNQFIFSMNKTKIKEMINITLNNSFYNNLIEYHTKKNLFFFNFVSKNFFPYIEMVYPSLYLKIKDYYDKEKSEFIGNFTTEIISSLSKEEPIINYDKSQISLIDHLNISEINTVIINDLVYGYLDGLFISLYFNPNQFLAIPVDENNYIKTKTTCFLFLVFQHLLESRDISKEQYYSLYHRIFNQDSTIYDCLSNVNIDEIKDILEIKSIPNLYYSEKKVAKLFNISGYKTHEILKYIYPSFKGLYYFKPKYIFENYFIIYLFINYAPAIKITNDYNQILFNCLLSIVLFCVMFWIIVIIILVYIEKKLSKDVTLPIIKLRQSIETMNLNDSRIFEYNEDDSINELFKTCKELLKGEIILKKKYNKDYLEEINPKNNPNLIIDNRIISEIVLNENIDRVEQDNIQYFEQYKFRRVLENRKKKLTAELRKDFGSRKDTFFLSNFYNTLKKKKESLSNLNEYQNDMEDLILYNTLYEMSENVFDRKNKNNNNINENLIYKTKKIEEDEIKIQNKKSVLYYWYMNTKKKRNGNIHNNKNKKTLMFLRKDNLFKNKINGLTYEQKLEKLKDSINEFKHNLNLNNSNDEINTSSSQK